MIFIDTNVFVIDLRYQSDPYYRTNKRFLQRVENQRNGVTGLINLLELCGILSFNLNHRQLEELFLYFPHKYGLSVLPSAESSAWTPSFKVIELIRKIQYGMALKDAEIALVVEEYKNMVTSFVSWNAKHFKGKLGCPVYTPKEALKLNLA